MRIVLLFLFMAGVSRCQEILHKHASPEEVVANLWEVTQTLITKGPVGLTCLPYSFPKIRWNTIIEQGNIQIHEATISLDDLVLLLEKN